MTDQIMYRFLTELDKPKRYISLTLDELVVAGISMLLLAACNQKIITTLIGMSVMGILRFLKKGGGPRALLVLMYWHLPHAITRFFLPTIVPSHLRVWVA